MRIFLLSSIAAAALAAPAAAHAGSPYVGVEVGFSQPRTSDVDDHVSFSATQTPSTPAAPAPPAGGEFDDTFAIAYKKGYDVGLLGGYDFGLLRVEMELSQKSMKLDSLKSDDITEEYLATLNDALNRPSASPDPGAPGLGALDMGDFELDGRMRLRSAMVNALVDVDVTKRLSIYGGGGYGFTWARSLGTGDSARGWQWIAGVRYGLTDKFDLGLKYRYFNSGIMTLRSDPQLYTGNPNRQVIGTTTVDQTVNATVMPEIEVEIRTRSLLASLIYNF